MKIFNVSPHRSGTQSFHQFCRLHGIASAHWPGSDLDREARGALPQFDTALLWRICAEYFTSADAFSDFPTALVYRHALEKWPNARFVLIGREPAEWVRSVIRHTQDRDLGYLERFFYQGALGWREQARLCAYSEAELAAAYRNHHAGAQAFLEARSAHLFVGALGDPAMPGRLADFMGFRPEHSFPAIA